MTVFFTADFHLGHKNVLWYQPNRVLRWPTITAHDNGLCDAWVAQVCPDDTVYHIGDFMLGRSDRFLPVLESLPGEIHLLPGNHDRRAVKQLRNREGLNSRFHFHDEEILEVEVCGMPFLLHHYPPQDKTWKGQDGWNGTIFLHGHSHGKFGNCEGVIDVGWDPMSALVNADKLVSRLLDRRKPEVPD